MVSRYIRRISTIHTIDFRILDPSSLVLCSLLHRSEGQQLQAFSRTERILRSSYSTASLPFIFDKHDDIIGAYTPVTKKLWGQRSRWNPEVLATARPQIEFTPKPPTAQTVAYPFSTDPALREHFRNPWGGVRLGLILEDMDSMAGFCSYIHTDDNEPSTRPAVLVTATVEAIHFIDTPLRLDTDMKMSGRVIWTGKSSMDILITVEQEDKTHVSALFTFVARDAVTGKAHQVNSVVPDDEETKQLFDQRQKIAEERKMQRAAEAHADQKFSAEQVAWVHQLLSIANLKRDMPALAEPGSITMPHTQLENTFTCQPQERNIHGKIFGGFLMRRAFELAHATGYLLSAVRPDTVLVDEIQFKAPVDVGDLIRFRSRVLRAWDKQLEGGTKLYKKNNISLSTLLPGNKHGSSPTHSPSSLKREEKEGEQGDRKGYIHVQVSASVIKPEAMTSYETNTFNFLFEVERRKNRDNTGYVSLPSILPTTDAEAYELCKFYGPGGLRHVN